MTDQTRWGIDLVHTKNKAIKRQKDIVKRSLAEVDKLEEQYIVELMMEIEAIYERKYGENKTNKLVLQVMEHGSWTKGQKGMQKDHGSVQNDSKKQGVATGVARGSGGVASVGISWQQCGNGHNFATIN